MAKKSSHPAEGQSSSEDRIPPLRVLVSWSPSSTGTEAIEFAAWLARSTPVQIRVVSTISQPLTVTSLSKLSGSYKQWFKKERATCERAVKQALDAAGVDKAQLDKNVSVLIAGPSRPQLLEQAATDFNAHVILLGANQSAPKGRFFSGSTADALLHYSPLPVGLTPRGIKLSKHGVTRINFAFTELGRADDPALRHAACIAQRGGIPLRILAFSAKGLVDVPLEYSPTFPSDAPNWREHSLSLLDRAHDFIAEVFPEISVTTDIGSGHGWSGAVDSLKWKKGDLLCLGSSPMGPIERVFIGSTATELLPHVGVPVLVCPSTYDTEAR
ncbi:universal stress protein [Corynebacterium aurimucosum]|uniref:Universal stress protein n=1 Tax=Corynebacterium aurimucosum TaxID=169292 RepID=A0A558IJZ0_9CORY|nr:MULTISPECIES: universal stress protein [Corynebacterium]OFK69633.1 universal stress protein [Corynebacterium sp. HMSC074A09]TVU81713.1 universal stress protein [Corynebacterium aurimucosum]